MNKKEIIKIIDKFFKNEDVVSIIRVIILLMNIKRRDKRKKQKELKK